MRPIWLSHVHPTNMNCNLVSLWAVCTQYKINKVSFATMMNYCVKKNAVNNRQHATLELLNLSATLWVTFSPHGRNSCRVTKTNLSNWAKWLIIFIFLVTNTEHISLCFKHTCSYWCLPETNMQSRKHVWIDALIFLKETGSSDTER